MTDNDDEIQIYHPNGMTTPIPDCFMKIIKYCGPLDNGGVAAYEGYDKFVVEHDNSLSPLDILLANNIGARLTGEDFVRIWGKSGEISEHLANMPKDVDLSDPSLDHEDFWKGLKELFKTCRCKGVSYSKITKILHKKRPRLIPIVDYDIVAHRYLDDSWLGASDIAEYLVAATQHIRGDVIRNERTLTAIKARLWNEEKIDLTLLRIFDILLYQHYTNRP
jgi:hypothetical protein